MNSVYVRIKKRGGGTSLYIHNDIQYKIRTDLSLPKQQYESIFIEVETINLQHKPKYNCWGNL